MERLSTRLWMERIKIEIENMDPSNKFRSLATIKIAAEIALNDFIAVEEEETKSELTEKHP
jgi:hypothetical protein